MIVSIPTEVDTMVVSVSAKTFTGNLRKRGIQATGVSFEAPIEELFPDATPTIEGYFVHLEVDIETGKILNWKLPSPQHIDRWISSQDTVA